MIIHLKIYDIRINGYHVKTNGMFDERHVTKYLKLGIQI